MKKKAMNFLKTSCLMAGLAAMTSSVWAAPFVYKAGDLWLGMRKASTSYDIVVDIGPATNFVGLAAGTTTNIVNYVGSQISPDSYANLTSIAWAVVGYTSSGNTFSGYARDTLWVTIPRVGGVAGTPPVRADGTAQGTAESVAFSIFYGAGQISGNLSAGKDNTTNFVQEPNSGNIANNENYSYWMPDPSLSSYGDLGGEGPEDASGNILNLESTTPSPFSSAQKADFYQLSPSDSTDPNTGTMDTNAYTVGYFQLNTDGSLSFTRASSMATPPTAAFSGSPTNGFAGLSTTFTDASTGTITNWLWTLGDGTSVTNTSNASVNHTYSAPGSYTVSLKVTGPGGNNTATHTGYIVVSSTPQFSSAVLLNGKLVIGGSNCPAGTQYRILSTTNLTTGSGWKPVYTNMFLSNSSFSYTNSTTNAQAFFKLVSP